MEYLKAFADPDHPLYPTSVTAVLVALIVVALVIAAIA